MKIPAANKDTNWTPAACTSSFAATTWSLEEQEKTASVPPHELQEQENVQHLRSTYVMYHLTVSCHAPCLLPTYSWRSTGSMNSLWHKKLQKDAGKVAATMHELSYYVSEGHMVFWWLSVLCLCPHGLCCCFYTCLPSFFGPKLSSPVSTNLHRVADLQIYSEEIDLPNCSSLLASQFRPPWQHQIASCWDLVHGLGYQSNFLQNSCLHVKDFPSNRAGSAASCAMLQFLASYFLPLQLLFKLSSYLHHPMYPRLQVTRNLQTHN